MRPFCQEKKEQAEIKERIKQRSFFEKHAEAMSCIGPILHWSGISFFSANKQDFVSLILNKRAYFVNPLIGIQIIDNTNNNAFAQTRFFSKIAKRGQHKSHFF